MVYYKIPISGGSFDYPAGCVLCCAYTYGGYIYCKFERVTSVGSNWVAITESEFNVRCPDFPAPDIPPAQAVVATSAYLSSGSVVLDLPVAVDTGTLVKFAAPCACSDVTDGIVIDDVTYSVVDSLGEVATDLGGAWDAGAQVAVIIDKAESKAYIQNAATSSYLEKNKQNTITGAATTIADSNLTKSRAIVSNASGKVAASPVTAAELGHLSGAKSNIQDQLDKKAPAFNALSMENGGTGAKSGDEGLKNLLSAGPMVFSAFQVGDTLPDPGIKNRLFIKEVMQEAPAGPGYFDLTESSFGITLRVHYSVNHNSEADTYDVTITKLQVMCSAHSDFLHYLDGTISIDGTAAVTMSRTAGGHSVYVSNKDVFYDITGTLGSVSGIANNGDGSKAITISVSVGGYDTNSSKKWAVSGSEDVALSAGGVSSVSYSLYIDTGTALVKITT